VGLVAACGVPLVPSLLPSVERVSAARGLRDTVHLYLEHAVDQFLQAVARGSRPHLLDAAHARRIGAVLDAAERQLARPAEQRATAPTA